MKLWPSIHRKTRKQTEAEAAQKSGETTPIASDPPPQAARTAQPWQQSSQHPTPEWVKTHSGHCENSNSVVYSGFVDGGVGIIERVNNKPGAEVLGRKWLRR